MIIKELVKLQKQKGISNSQFAKSLGIHTNSWYRNKRTGVISADTLLRALAVYPDIRETLLYSFVGDTLNLTEKAHKPILGVLGQKIRDYTKRLLRGSR